MKKTLLSCILSIGLSTVAVATNQNLEETARDAWTASKAETTSLFTDTKISTMITGRLFFSSVISGSDISVSVKNGKVLLHGVVNSAQDRDLVISMAKNTADVGSVKAQLLIRQTSKA